MSTLFVSDRILHPSDCSGFRMFSPVPSVFKGWNVVRVPPRAQCFRRSAAGSRVVRVQNPPKCVHERTDLSVASISTRSKKDGSKSYMVRWRDKKTKTAQGLTVATLTESETLKRLLDANGQSFENAQHPILTNEKRPPTVAEVIQEHIDLLVRPSSGTVKT